MTDKEAKKMFKEIDTDKSGAIDYHEWISATINKKKLLSDKNLRTAFDAFDENGDGTITVDEIKNILGKGKKTNEKVWEEVLAEADDNNDGLIDFDEFKKMMAAFM